MYRLDSRENKWTVVTPMVTKRMHGACAVINGCIYVAGGHSGSAYLSSVEFFDPRTEQWTDAADMNSPRSAVCYHLF